MTTLNPHTAPDDSNQPRLLLVDDESAVRSSLARALRQGFRDRLIVETCSGAALALRRLSEKQFDVLISDLRMPSIDGMALMEQAARMQPDCLRMILTATADFETAQRAVNGFGIFRYLTKPWDPKELCRHVEEALTALAARREQAAAGSADQAADDLVWPTLRLNAITKESPLPEIID
jgi:DNA-binding NtrC family response regulator